MTDPLNDLSGRLARILPPAEPAGPAGRVLDHFDLLHDRLQQQLAIAEAVRQRFPHLPEPAARQSLQELVQAGRRTLRNGRADVDESELHAQLVLVDRFRGGLA
jgi:hypothetical protein